jgi:hypothetical protein
MSANTLVLGGQAAVTAHCPAYYFDFVHIFERCEALRQHPERIALMCQNRVRAIALGELMLTREQGFFLIVQTRVGPAAEALANEISVALMQLFFGSDSLTGLAALFRALPYEEMCETGIAMPPPQPTAPAAQIAAGGLQAGISRSPVRNPDPLEHLAQSTLPGFEGLKSGFLPMFNIQRESPSIYMCGAVGRRYGKMEFGPAALRCCSPKDRPSLDEAMLEYSVGFTRQIVPTKFTAAISTSVSYETLAWSRGRQLYQHALRALDAANNPFLVVKIDDVPPGTPASRLAEIVATVRPFVKRVVLHLPVCDVGLIQSGQIGAAALCATLPAYAKPPAIERFATWLNRTAMGQQALSCVDGIYDANALPLLRAAGIRFAAGCADEDSIHLGNPLDGPPAAYAA